MKKAAVIVTMLVTSILSGPWAMAQGESRNHSRQRVEKWDHRDYGERRENRDNRENKGRRYSPQDRFDRGEQGAGPNHNYYRGDRLPNQYRSYQYVVEDWRGHGLRMPPRGYHWVQNGSDYILVAVATGLILELLLNR